MIEVGQITEDGNSTKEVIFVATDKGWQSSLPVTLITYKDGSQDLHRQTGHNFKEHIVEAEKILLQRGLIINKRHEVTVGSTGAYLTVIKIDDVLLRLARAETALTFARKWLQPVTLEANLETFTPEEKVQRILAGNFDKTLVKKT